MLVLTGGGLAMVQPGFSDVDGRLATLSSAGDPLERLSAAVDFELFRAMLDAALVRSDRSRGGRPPNDAVLMFKVLVLQALYSLSDDAAEFQARDRLSFMRFPGLGLGDRVPNAKTIWLSREQFVRPDAMEKLYKRFDAALHEAGYLAMGGQIIDATVVAAPRQKLTGDEKAVVRSSGTPPGRSAAKRRQKPASSGKTSRHRLNRGGNRRANAALYRVALVRMRHHPSTRDYIQRRTAEGKSPREIRRCLKRYIAREIYRHLCTETQAAPNGNAA